MYRSINAAEAVICPFWDPELHELDRWTVTNGDSHGLSVYQFWCWTTFEWVRTPAKVAALEMRRDMDTDCSGYDTLVVSLMAPESSILELSADTDKGLRRYTSPPAGTLKKEHRIPLDGAKHISALELRIYEGDSEIRSGWINWIGLQTSDLLPFYERQWNDFDSEWAGYIRPRSFAPSYTPAYGIVADADEIAAVQESHSRHLSYAGSSPFTDMADSVRGTCPENSIGEYVGFFSSTRLTIDTRYNRERDHDKRLVTSGQKAAFAGVVLRDPELLRLAARYAMSIAMCPNWEDGMINRFPGSTFDTRCFVQALCLHDIAVILDLAGEMFTDLGRTYLLRRLSEEGLATVTYNTWRYEYLFHCNQLAWFTPGRMLASLVVEREWPRAKKYTDICYQDLVESMNLSILPDGGYVEGPTYFQCVGRDANLSFFYYARARNLELDSIVPDIIRKSDAFGAAVASTDTRQDVIPVCDAKSTFDQLGLAFLDRLMPGSAWSAMLAKSLQRSRMPTTLPGAILSKQPEDYRRKPLVILPDMGLVASHRLIPPEEGTAHEEVSPREIKILVLGNRAGAGHTHEDKGSFVLEFAGETFAMDPGTCNYSDPLSSILKNCGRHNMLVPTGMSERPRPANPIDRDITPNASGDETNFIAEVDLTAGWEGYYRMWRRRFESSDPTHLTIEDTYELIRGSGVVFYWNTMLPVEIDHAQNTVRITGKNGIALVQAHHECVFSIEELPLPQGEKQRRIGVSKSARSGTLRILVRLKLI